jgi:hypothetical protein
MAGVSSAATMWFLQGVLFLILNMRYFMNYIKALRKQ